MPFEMFWATPVYWSLFDEDEEALKKIDVEVSSSMEKYEEDLNRPWDDKMLTSFHPNWMKEYPEKGRYNTFLQSCPLLESYVKKHTNFFLDFFSLHKNFNEFDITESWFNKGSKFSYQNYHKHAGSDISGCYYHQTNEQDGNITFRTDSTGLRMSKLYPYDDITYKPAKGKIILFPSFLEHCVLMNSTDGERISISFNINLMT